MNKTSAKITALLEFSETGYLRSILLDAKTDGDQKVLETALSRLFKPVHFGWLSRLIQRLQ